MAPPQHAASGASSLGSLGSVGSCAFSPASTAQLASTAQRPASDTLRGDAAAPGQHTPHVALPAAPAADPTASENPSAAAVAAAVATAPAIRLASLPVTPPSPAATNDSSADGVGPEQWPQSAPAAAKRPATPQQRPRRPSLARISETGSTYSLPLEVPNNSSSAACSPADEPQHQPRVPQQQPADLDTAPRIELDSKQLDTGGSELSNSGSAPEASVSALDDAASSMQPAAAEPAATAQLTGSSAQAQRNTGTGGFRSSAATASVWNEVLVT